MTCLAGIVREYKTTKADSVWPVRDGTRVEELPPGYTPCFGHVTAEVKAVQEPEWGGTSTELRVVWTCSRCKSPFVARRLEIDAMAAAGALDLDRLAELVQS